MLMLLFCRADLRDDRTCFATGLRFHLSADKRSVYYSSVYYSLGKEGFSSVFKTVLDVSLRLSRD